MNLDTLLHNKYFKSDYELLKSVSLNPERHTASNAHEHCQMVVSRASELAHLNDLSELDTTMVVMLAYLHDIGKTQGTAKPIASVELLPKYDMFDSGVVDYVKYHDINLPWYIAYSKGQTPGDKAWRKLVNKISIKLLCLFMIADRVDCPGGWQTNEPLMWFLNEVKRRELLNEELVY